MKFIKAGIKNWIEGEGYSKNLLLDNIDLISSKSLVQIIKIKSGNHVDNHFHRTTTEIFYGLLGNGIFTIEDKDFTFGAGDLLICEKNEVHSVKNSTDEDWLYLAVKTDNKSDTFWGKNP